MKPPRPPFKKRRITLPQKELRGMFHYDPDTGDFYRRENGKLPPIGKQGYRCVALEGQNYLLHRVIWVWMTGEDVPEGLLVDHRDRNKLNNRWRNLRLATQQQNKWNSWPGKSLAPNVSYSNTGWWVFLRIDGRPDYRKRHDRLVDALDDARRVRIEHHGEFAIDLNGYQVSASKELEDALKLQKSDPLGRHPGYWDPGAPRGGWPEGM